MSKRAKNTVLAWGLSFLSFFSSGPVSANTIPITSHEKTKADIENINSGISGQPNDSTSVALPPQNDNLSHAGATSFEDIYEALVQNDSIYQKYIGQMEQQGRFFINVSDSSDIIYLTNEQISQNGINAAAGIFDVCLGRENNITFSSDPSRFLDAYTNISGSYFGPFQYSGEHMKSMVLWTLCQKDKDCQTFARLCIASAMNLAKNDSIAPFKLVNSYNQAHDDVVAGKISIIETLTIDGKPILKDNSALIAFMESYDDAVERINNGENSIKTFNNVFAAKGRIRNAALASVSLQEFSDPILKYAGEQMNLSQIKYVFDKDAGERYFPMNVNITDLKNISFTAWPALFMARIHGSYSEDLAFARQNKPDQSIIKHSRYKDPRAVKRARTIMRKAQKNIIKNINGKQYYDYSFYRACLHIIRQQETPAPKMIEYAANFAIEQKRQTYTVSSPDINISAVNYIQTQTSVPENILITTSYPTQTSVPENTTISATVSYPNINFARMRSSGRE